MVQKYPDFNDYWQDKRAKVENINVHAYVLASYSTFLHTFGSFRGFEAIRNENKWYVAPTSVVSGTRLLTPKQASAAPHAGVA